LNPLKENDMNAPTTNFAEPRFGNIPLACVIPSKTNPRKHFNDVGLEELASSIKQHGVAQPILVRPLPTTEDMIDCVEIVAGERRYRASKLAGLESIPAIVRELTDVQALEIQVIENLQREDVHPIEEAEGYDQLMKLHGYTSDQLAEKVGKSRSYIYGRLKFCALAPAARDAFFDGKLSASTALLIARIPVESLQAHATEELANDGDPLSYRAAFEHIQERYMLKLDRARFPIADAKLVKAAGDCDACPKRTGNQPMIFKDVSADICTDPNCFASKSRAHDDKTLAAAQKKGIPVYEGEEAEEFIDENELISTNTPLYEFDRRVDNASYSRPVEELLTPDQLPKPTAYVRIDGKVSPMYEPTAMQEALEKAGICETAEQLQARKQGTEQSSTSSMATPARKAAAPDIRAITAEQETKVRVEAYKRIRAAAQTGLTVELLRSLLKNMLGQFGYSDFSLPDDVLGDIYTFNTSTEDSIFEHIDQAPMEELMLLLMDALVGSAIDVSSYDMNNDGSLDEDDEGFLSFVALTEAAGVDLMAIRTELAPADGQPASDLAPKVGDRVRINNDLRDKNSKPRSCCGKEGTIESIDDAYYTVRTGPKSVVKDLVENEFTRIDDTKVPPVTKRVLSPDAAWPFPTRG
jgi:ParB/RepB/Spo0J family partition protein